MPTERELIEDCYLYNRKAKHPPMYPWSGEDAN
ncbi:hypothetical protein LCGC14_1860480 [marine sediment metagenome]|uniref:Uncharacterized protein n=1 Tax=marine sediment metagenome TaxID=412755 RepID=A0A0F9G834_9ZZZZ